MALGLTVPLAAGLLLSGTQPIRADQYTDQISQDQRQQQAYDNEIASLRSEIANAQDKEAALNAAIVVKNAQIDATKAQIRALGVVLDALAHLHDAKEGEYTATQQQLATDKKRLSAEVVLIYETENKSTPISNLITSGDFNSFWRQVIDDQRIGDVEATTAAQIQIDENTEHDELQQIEAVQRQQEAKQAQQQQQETELAAEGAQLQAAYNYLAYLQQQDAAKIAAINAANDALNAQIAQLQAAEAAALAAGGGSGRFVWPDIGPITQGFGCTQWTFEPYDANCPYPHRFHNGIDIAGPCGHDIVAADAGIAYIEPFQAWGFGNYVIIVHGNGWETLYGHMSGFAIGGGGQRVSRGQVIGYEGSTGNSTGCHLHFGVNDNNSWVNPLNYLS